jgi:hypothetical protein
MVTDNAGFEPAVRHGLSVENQTAKQEALPSEAKQ